MPALVDDKIAQTEDERAAERHGGTRPGRAGFQSCVALGGWLGGGGLQRRDVGRIDPRSYRRDQAVPAAWNICNVCRLFRVIAEDAPERCHGVIDRIRRDHDTRPYSIEQLFHAENLIWVFGET